MSTARAEEL